MNGFSRISLHLTLFCSAFVAPLQTIARNPSPSDWPQWRGPDRNGKSEETGLLQSWPSSGLKKAWTNTQLGDGYGSTAIYQNRVYVQGTTNQDESMVLCLDRETGRRLWMQPIGPGLDHGRGGGPRGTPTVQGEFLYALSETGELACLRSADGTPLWSRNLRSAFEAQNIAWHFSESPLIDRDRVIVTPGGSRATIVSLDKEAGHTVWKTEELSDPAGYASCVIAEIQGIRTVTTLTARAAVGVRADDGKLMWRYEKVANRTANVSTPIVDGNKIFYTSAYGTGCALLSLHRDGSILKAEEVYFNQNMMNHHGGVVLHNGYLYGFSNSILTCMEFQSGQVIWKDRSVGKGSVIYADNRLYLLGERNLVALANAAPDSYQEMGRFPIEDRGLPTWAHPVVSDGRLYIRNRGSLACYDLAAKEH